MPPKRLELRRGLAGEAFRQSIEELDALEARTRYHGTAVWGKRIREYPDHRRLIMAAVAGLKAVQEIVHPLQLPQVAASTEILWTATHVATQGKGKTQTVPRHVWRENTRSLWWAVLVPLLDYWEQAMSEELPHESEARRLVDDLTTAVDLLGGVRFPDNYARLF